MYLYFSPVWLHQTKATDKPPQMIVSSSFLFHIVCHWTLVVVCFPSDNLYTDSIQYNGLYLPMSFLSFLTVLPGHIFVTSSLQFLTAVVYSSSQTFFSVMTLAKIPSLLLGFESSNFWPRDDCLWAISSYCELNLDYIPGVLLPQAVLIMTSGSVRCYLVFFIYCMP